MKIQISFLVFLCSCLLITGCEGRVLEAVELPESWDDDIPIMDCMTPIAVQLVPPNIDQNMTIIAFYADCTRQDVLEFYLETKGPWEVFAPEPPFVDWYFDVTLVRSDLKVLITTMTVGSGAYAKSLNLQDGDTEVTIWITPK